MTSLYVSKYNTQLQIEFDDAQSPTAFTYSLQNVVEEYPIGTVTYESDDADENAYDEHDDGSVVLSHITVDNEVQ